MILCKDVDALLHVISLVDWPKHVRFFIAMLFRFMLIRAFGLMGQLQKAAAAFDEMQRLGFWQPNDVRTANALLNALHTDATETYKRYCFLSPAYKTYSLCGVFAIIPWMRE